MGLTGISIWQLLILLAIVIVLFGTKRLRTLGSDLGSMIKGFKSSMNNDDPPKPDEQKAPEPPPQPIAAQQTAATPQPATEKTDQNKV